MGANCPDNCTSTQGQKPVLSAWCARLHSSRWCLLVLLRDCACHLPAEVKVGESIGGQSALNVRLALIKLAGDAPLAHGVCYGGVAGFAVGLAPVAAAQVAAVLK
jgi:hypothetical protein